MQPYASWKFWMIITLFIGALMGAAPNVSHVPSWWPASMSQPLNLGLDLKGGIHLVIDVDIEKVIELEVSGNVKTVMRALRDEDIFYQKRPVSQGSQIHVVLKNSEDAQAAAQLLQDVLIGYDMDEPEEGTLVFTLTEKEGNELKKYAINQVIEVIRRRVDALGTSEPVIMRQGERRVLVQLPGYQDSATAKQMIGQTAQLEFKLVDEKGEKNARAGYIPQGDMLGYFADGRTILLKRRTELSGADVAMARLSIDAESGEPAVSLKFNNQGARKFDRLTKEHKGRRFAILLEGIVQSAPVIRERISGGTAQITGSFDTAEALNLAIVLRAGALPAPIKIVEERSIGPSLGQDSIDQGLDSIIYGCVAVLIFMMLYYRLFGLVANIALLFNILLIAAAMSMFGATLTLPGIAGIVLTIGMAVDANVLIFERIREEMRAGKPPFAAIDGGYNKALLTIMDANITTLIAALFLFQFGSGPIKGFAITLAVGIAASMFTAIIVTRAIIVLSHRKKTKLKTLSI